MHVEHLHTETCNWSRPAHSLFFHAPNAPALQALQGAAFRRWFGSYDRKHKGVEPKIGGFYRQNGCFIMENLIKMEDLGIPLFLVQHPQQKKWKQSKRPLVRDHPLCSICCTLSPFTTSSQFCLQKKTTQRRRREKRWWVECIGLEIAGTGGFPSITSRKSARKHKNRSNHTISEYMCINVFMLMLLSIYKLQYVQCAIVDVPSVRVRRCITYKLCTWRAWAPCPPPAISARCDCTALWLQTPQRRGTRQVGIDHRLGQVTTKSFKIHLDQKLELR